MTWRTHLAFLVVGLFGNFASQAEDLLCSSDNIPGTSRPWGWFTGFAEAPNGDLFVAGDYDIFTDEGLRYLYRVENSGAVSLLLEEDQVVPGGDGVFGAIDNRTFQVLDSGALLFTAEIKGEDKDAIFLWTEAEGVVEIVRDGDAEPLTGAGTFRSAEIVGIVDEEQFYLQDSGDVKALYVWSRSNGLQVAREVGETLADGRTITDFSSFRVNASGQVRFTGQHDQPLPGGFGEALFADGPNEELRVLLNEGDGIAGFGEPVAFIDRVELNDDGFR